MPRVGLITAPDLPDLHEDEAPFVAALRAHDLDPTPVVWGEAALAAEVDVLVMRTAWDWHLHGDAFARFLAALPEARTFNAPSLMRTHLDKGYLARLSARGVPTVPFAQVEGGAPALAEARARRGWTRVVVKPLRSASAHRTFRIDEPAQLAAMEAGSWLLSPFVEEIAGGELSFVFFDGRFSHAVRKRPRAGDFRVQAEHGGTNTLEAPAPALVAAAARALHALGEPPLYARVDGVVVADELLVMELEVVEPQLFFALCPQAGETMARALAARISGR